MKYKTIVEGTMLRIIALKDFTGVKAGERGGLIEKEANLSQSDNAWVSDNARVYGGAQVSDNARVSGDARILRKTVHTKKVIVIQASQHVITVDGNYINIGCESRTKKQWLKNFEKIGKAHGYLDEEIREYGAIIKLINKIY